MTIDHHKDRFSQNPEVYLKSHHVIAHLSHALSSLVTVRDADPKIQPFQYMAEYFRRISEGRHVVNQVY